MWQVDSVHAFFIDDEKERSVNKKLGLSNYESTPWEVVDGKTGTYRRSCSYRLNRLITQFGSKISCIQQKTISTNSKKLIINEILTLHDVPFGDHFQVSSSPPFYASYFTTCISFVRHILMGICFSLPQEEIPC
jgi:hypothetical protein